MVLVLVDYREPPEIVNYLVEKGVPVQRDNMPIDYMVIGAKTCVLIERKTMVDFAASLRDGRIWKQCEELSNMRKELGELYEKVSTLIIVEGSFRELKKFTQWKTEAIVGALKSIVVGFDISLIRLPSIAWTADFIYYTFQDIRDKEAGENSVAPVRRGKKPKTHYEIARTILESIPGIGPKTAVELLQHFGSLKQIFEASEAELTMVVGRALARRIKEVWESEVKP